MNTNPQAKVILCFGDSNTWGQNEDKGFGERYPVNVRWTGRLQQLLGTDYYVIEEGLGGRTVDLDDPRPEKPGRNGFDYFLPCFISHSRVDLAVIMSWCFLAYFLFCSFHFSGLAARHSFIRS